MRSGLPSVDPHSIYAPRAAALRSSSLGKNIDAKSPLIFFLLITYHIMRPTKPFRLSEAEVERELVVVNEGKDVVMRMISQGLVGSSALETLIVTQNNLYAEGGRLLAAALAQNQRLSVLDLAGNFLGRESLYKHSDVSCISALCDGIIKDNGTLTRLSLADNRLATEAAGKLLSSMLAVNSALTEINLSSNEFDDNEEGANFALALCCGLSSASALIKLNLHDNNFSDAGAGKALGDMLAVNTTLRCLDISACEVQAESALAFADGLSNNHTLQALNLASNTIGQRISQDGWVHDADQEFAYISVDEEEQHEAPQGQLFGPAGALAMIDAAKENGSLTQLNLSDNQILSEGVGKALAQLLQHNTTLTELDLSDNGNRFKAADATQFIQGCFVGLRDSRTLSRLSMRNNNLMTRASGKELSNILASNSAIKEIDLSNNYDSFDASDPGGFVEELSVGLRNNDSLVTLSLSDNRFECANTGTALGGVLKDNTTLEELDISECGLSLDFASAFVDGLAASKALTSLDISGSSCDGAEAVLQICSTKSIVCRSGAPRTPPVRPL
jgi:Ran GTPase-activating protein (RanGAP) involved in mRNA processing and transport